MIPRYSQLRAIHCRMATVSQRVYTASGQALSGLVAQRSITVIGRRQGDGPTTFRLEYPSESEAAGDGQGAAQATKRSYSHPWLGCQRSGCDISAGFDK